MVGAEEEVRIALLPFIEKVLHACDAEGIEFDHTGRRDVFRRCEAAENAPLLTEFTPVCRPQSRNRAGEGYQTRAA